MLSYATPARIAANNTEAERLLASQEKVKGTGLNGNGAPELSNAQAKDFAHALERRKIG